jgi:hypothetical protein
MKTTTPVFVVGSGRCGTRMIKKLLSGVDTIEARHEYVRNAFQRESTMYLLGKLSYEDITKKLLDIYSPAIYYSEAEIFLDSNQHLCWCVDVLADAFPDSKFIHLVRDGRKVVSSFFHKLNIFDDHGAKVLRDWMEGRETVPPPLTENFWQILPPDGYDMFQRICYHWVRSNEDIMNSLDAVTASRKIFIRLEDLVTSEIVMEDFLHFLNVPYSPVFMDAMKHPEHVYVPVDFKLTEEQQKQFQDIAQWMQLLLGYTEDEYSVSY